MSTLPVPRWAVSLADLTMLLLAFFVLLHAADERTLVTAAHAAFPGEGAGGPLLEAPAEALFERGEARLKPEARLRVAAAARQAGPARLAVESIGRPAGGSRFDGWELAAARAAALARALADAGVREGRIDIVMPPLRDKAHAPAQTLTVRTVG
ncbi:MAG TPA: flagellar motor protein MotB [Allosphingosinicella sp.]|jgi:flagellar motor protein MotB|nr:flagellar motor protein MotB [Allosphingosinicella sp.]